LNFQLNTAEIDRIGSASQLRRVVLASLYGAILSADAVEGAQMDVWRTETKADSRICCEPCYVYPASSAAAINAHRSCEAASWEGGAGRNTVQWTSQKP
jgi:hypothetical protein